MAKIESERRAEAYIIGFLITLLDEAGVLRSKAVAQELRKLADEKASGEGRRYIIDVADGIDGGPSADLAKPSLN